MNFSHLKISTRLSLLLAALCLLTTVIGSVGLAGMQRANAGLNTVYQDRVVPLKQIKLVSDAYAVNVVDTAHKVRDGALTPQQGLDSIAKAKKEISDNWSAYLATELVADEVRLTAQFKTLQPQADGAARLVLGQPGPVRLVDTDAVPAHPHAVAHGFAQELAGLDHARQPQIARIPSGIRRVHAQAVRAEAEHQLLGAGRVGVGHPFELAHAVQLQHQ